jgi:hypothetical protein
MLDGCGYQQKLVKCEKANKSEVRHGMDWEKARERRDEGTEEAEK